jgi:hypothetical protein
MKTVFGNITSDAAVAKTLDRICERRHRKADGADPVDPVPLPRRTADQCSSK